MKKKYKYKFFFSTGSVHGKVDEIVEFDEPQTEEELEEWFNRWLVNFDSGWYEVEDET